MKQINLLPAKPGRSLTSGAMVEWEWICPKCGGEVIATNQEKATEEEIESNPACYKCRAPAVRTVVSVRIFPAPGGVGEGAE